MASGTGRPVPPKPWERAPSTSGPSPFKPASAGPTTAVIELSGVAQPGDKAPVAPLNGNTTLAGRQMPPRPWERRNSNGGGYNTMSNYGGYRGGNNYGAYGNNYGGNYGSLYGGGNGAGAGYGGGTYGSYGLGNMYGGGLYGSQPYGGYGAPMPGGGYGMGMGMGGPGLIGYDPNNSNGESPPGGPPPFWQSLLKVLYGVVTFFGRISFLVDQNTQAFHFFITALLQLFDRAGMLYGELARFIFRFLGIRTPPKSSPKKSHDTIQGPNSTWDSVFDDVNKSG